MKKLVRIDPVSKHYTEIDTQKLRRVTINLLAFIKKEISPNADPHGIWQWVVPLCEGIMSGTIDTPIPYSTLPLKYQLREGLLSEQFEDLYAPFANCVTGTPLENNPEIIIDGDLYTYAEFED